MSGHLLFMRIFGAHFIEKHFWFSWITRKITSNVDIIIKEKSSHHSVTNITHTSDALYPALHPIFERIRQNASVPILGMSRHHKERMKPNLNYIYIYIRVGGQRIRFAVFLEISSSQRTRLTRPINNWQHVTFEQTICVTLKISIAFVINIKNHVHDTHSYLRNGGFSELLHAWFLYQQQPKSLWSQRLIIDQYRSERFKRMRKRIIRSLDIFLFYKCRVRYIKRNLSNYLNYVDDGVDGLRKNRTFWKESKVTNESSKFK